MESQYMALALAGVVQAGGDSVDGGAQCEVEHV